VNQYWMCDEGMLTYRRVTDGRVRRARVKGKRRRLEKALAAAAKRLRGVSADQLGVVLSAQHSNEDNTALLLLAREVLGAPALFMGERPDGDGDAILRDPDKNPNRAGVEMLCGDTQPASLAELAGSVADGKISHVLALGVDAEAEVVDGLAASRGLIVLGTHETPLTEQATVLLPACTWAECSGTYVNREGLVQRSDRAVDPLGDARPAWQLVRALGQRLGKDLGLDSLERVRRAMTAAAGEGDTEAGAAGSEAGAEG
jgi:NADH-quinone oxidoreductase subunit G